jgi:hypothetical protein
MDAVESALRLDIDAIRRWGVIQPGAHLVGEMTFDFYDDKLRINFESCAEDPRESWPRLQYAINDYWTGELYQIDDKIYLAHSRPTFGGLRWWFVCPRLNRRVRKLISSPWWPTLLVPRRISSRVRFAARNTG